jgi:hypothetical protein
MGNFDSLNGQVRAGELIPLLQLTSSTNGALDIPQLGGPDGLARRRAAVTGRTPREAEQAANDLAIIAGAGRLVVAPPNLPDALSDCLGYALGEVLQSAEFLQAASRAQMSIRYQDSAAAYRSLMAGARSVDRFSELINAVIRQARE